MKTPQKEIDKIIELHLAGLSSRKIVKQLETVKSKSTVNNIIALWKDEVIKISEDINEDTDEVVVDDSNNIDTLCEHPDWTVSNLAKRLRSAQRTNNQLRKIQREVFDGEGQTSIEDILLAVEERMKGETYVLPTYVREGGPSNRIIEILGSDFQYGKCSQFYNSEVAEKAMKYHGQEIMKHVIRVKPDSIIFAALGDLVEDHLKHGVQSAISTDTGLAEQMANVIEDIWVYLLAPLASYGVPVTFIGIAGNHGSSEHKGMDSYKAGRYGYDYTIYRSLELLCKTAGLTRVKFVIPEGCFATAEIYGQKYLYEHGYTNGVGSEKQMLDHKKKRGENLKEYIHGFRCADKHHSVAFDNSNLVCNGSYFGVEMEGAEYSGIAGFNSIPVQGMFVHEPTTGVGQSTIVESHWIQIAKGY